MPNKLLEELKKEAKQAGFKVILQNDQTYTTAKQIVNLRFDFEPSGIAYCKQAKDVQICINFCREKKIPIRIRSGGHQHEGMCSANQVLIIDLSELNTIDYSPIGNYAWIPPGRKLVTVYQELERKGYTIPGGVCDAVNVGGLTQGCGWGISTRKLGYTCDNIEAVEIVLADGKCVIARANNEYADLLWALRGGGGGNFGVITRYLFKLYPLDETIVSFSFSWEAKETDKAALNWVKMQLDLNADPNLTVGGRLAVAKGNTARITFGGLYYGSYPNAQKALKELLAGTRPIMEKYTIIRRRKPQAATAELSSNSLTIALSEIGQLINPVITPSSKKPKSTTELPGITIETSGNSKEMPGSIESAPLSTCVGQHANKVSSALPKNNDLTNAMALMNATLAYIKNSEHKDDLNNYVSLHGIGGQAQKEPVGGSAFPYRDRAFIFKIQAWWNLAVNPAQNKSRTVEYVQWVKDFRLAIKEYIDGAFINFQDKDLVEQPDIPIGRIALLRHYYAENLPELRDIKTKYDQGNLFNFGMSIPIK